MLRMFLASQMNRPRQSRQLRAAAVGVVGVMTVVIVMQGAVRPPDVIELATWTLLIAALVVGACFTGWRVVQFPKSRAAEFHLVTPLSDRELICGEVLGGMLRTALAIGAAAPIVMAIWGAGWIHASEALALLAVPIAGGWLAGLLLAVVAYEPASVRRLLERLVLVAILGYLVLFGLLGSYCLPRLIDGWSRLTGTPISMFGDVGQMMRYFNPFRLLGSVAETTRSGLLGRTAGVLVVVLGISALALCRLSARLRRHYHEENYGHARDKKVYGRRIRDNPLAWWTRRRVSRFKGNVNLYLTWVTIGLYGAWLNLGYHWPAELARNQLLLLQHLGGASLLAVSALHLSVVPTAFLNGLWDSSTSQRAGRLELLLVTPLTGWNFFHASAVAAWTRGRGYVLGALAMWAAAFWAGQLTWQVSLILCLLAANYWLLSFALAFRSFARLPDDQAVTVHGLAWVVGLPLATVGLFHIGGAVLAAASPLGAVYLLARPAAQRAALTGASLHALWGCVAVTTLLYGGLSVWLLRRALSRFDREIHSWFAGYLAAG